MSAHKTAFIRLGESEYKRLRDAEEKIRLINLQESDAISDRDAQTQSIYENMKGINKHNDQKFRNLLVDMECEISKIENEAFAWVETQANKMQSELNHHRIGLQNQTSDQFDELINIVDQKIRQNENEMRAYWFAQEEKIIDFENRVIEYEGQARKWIGKNQEMLEFIYDTYQVDAQTANQLEFQRQILNEVISQYNQGYVEIAAPAAFQIFINLSNIHFQVEMDRALQNVQYFRLLQKVEQIKNTLSFSQTVHAMDAEGNELPDLLDVDYWVEGQFNLCKHNTENMIAKILSDPLMDLKKILEYDRFLEQVFENILDLVTQARIVVLASQLRFNVAQIIVEALEEQGFFLETANYMKDDYRESFIAKTINNSGNEVVVSIDPDPALDEGGKILIHSMDASEISEYELLQRNIEIFNAIKDNGIVISDIQVDYPGPDTNSMSKFKEKEPLPVISNVLEDKLKYGRD